MAEPIQRRLGVAVAYALHTLTGDYATAARGAAIACSDGDTDARRAALRVRKRDGDHF
jgi:hypothetical protein